MKSRRELIQSKFNDVLNEYTQNLLNLKKSFNLSIPFYESFQLLHFCSNKFVTTSKENADLEKENKKCELGDFSQIGSLFYLAPIFKHQMDRQSHAYFGEEVYILSQSLCLNQKMYLHFSEIEETTLQTQQALSLREVNLSIHEKKIWTLNLFDNLENLEEPEMNFGDIIWILNLEYNSIMTAVAKEAFSVDEIVIAGIGEVGFAGKGIGKDLIGSYNGLWQIENANKNLRKRGVSFNFFFYKYFFIDSFCYDNFFFH